MKKKRRWYWWSPMFADWMRGKPRDYVSDGLRLRFRKPRCDDPPSYYHEHQKRLTERVNR